MVSLQRLSVHARLDDSPEPLARAKTEAAAGDESWEQWLADYKRGDALIIRLELMIEVGGDETQTLTSSTSGYFVENTAHPPKLEHQIAELATGDLVSLAENLRADGHAIDAQELQDMYVHVQLGEDVVRRLPAPTR